MMSLNPLFTIGEQIAEPLRVHRGMRGSGPIRPPQRAAPRGAYSLA